MPLSPPVPHISHPKWGAHCPCSAHSQQGCDNQALALPLPQGLPTLPLAWSHPFLKPTSPTGQDPDRAQVHGHLALHPGHVSPRAGRPGERVTAAGWGLGPQGCHSPTSLAILSSSLSLSSLTLQMGKVVPTSWIPPRTRARVSGTQEVLRMRSCLQKRV